MGRDRDKSAFAELFRGYAPRVKAFLLGRGASGATADELTQEVMLSIWRKAELFEPSKGAASTWIFSIARNAFIDQIRRERRPEPEVDDPALVAQTPTPEAQVASGEARRILARALDALPDEQSATLKAAYLRGRSLPEIADEHRVPLGTVKTRVRLALERLRGLLAGEGSPS